MSKKRIRTENDEKLIASFHLKEEEMKQDIRFQWSTQVEKFLSESEYFSAYEYLKKQLNRQYDRKHPMYTLGMIGIHKFDAIHKDQSNSYGRHDSKEDIEANNSRRLDKFVNEQIEMSIEIAREKLLNSIYKFIGEEVIQEVRTIYMDDCTGYLEGRFEITTNESVHNIRTRGIYAGGYNIQKYHIRYLSKEL
jgi:hypothetical protein